MSLGSSLRSGASVSLAGQVGGSQKGNSERKGQGQRPQRQAARDWKGGSLRLVGKSTRQDNCGGPRVVFFSQAKPKERVKVRTGSLEQLGA